MAAIPVPKVAVNRPRIRYLLDERDWTQQRLAQAIDHDASLLSKEMRGSRDMDLTTLIAIGFVLGVPWQSLLAAECAHCRQPLAAA